MPNSHTTDTAYQAVLASYHRCEDAGGFFDTFYNIFFGMSPEIAPKFAATDMEFQKQVLGASLLWMLRLGRGDLIARHEIEKIGRSHSRAAHDIPPYLYSLWLDALCQAVERHDPQITPELNARWRAIMEEGIDLIVSRY